MTYEHFESELRLIPRWMNKDDEWITLINGWMDHSCRRDILPIVERGSCQMAAAGL